MRAKEGYKVEPCVATLSYSIYLKTFSV